MDARTVNACRLTLLVLVLVAAAATARAEVARVEITSRTEVLGGKSFGRVGPYEKIVGKIFFALDPDNPRNKPIVDLDKAPQSARGQVEFWADLFVLRPKDPSRGNGVLFFDVVNRGNKGLLRNFNLAESSTDPTTEADYGDGFLMREGYTVVAVGWESSPNNPAVALYAPIATDNGKPITGRIGNWFIPLEASQTFHLTSQYWTGFRAYPPLDPGDSQYRLTERVGFHGEPRLVPREAWQFGRLDNDKLVDDPQFLFLKTRFKPGYTYELTYQTQAPRVAGVGFAAIRDAASYFKHDPDAVISGQYAYAYGSSQTGRFLRALIHEGFTVDERERKALDAVWVNVGGASLGSFNERFAQPNDGGFHSQTKFPFLYASTRDPITGRMDGLGARIPDGLHPKVLLVESSSEYWDRGRVSALNHTSMDGREDLRVADNVRIYVLASIPHGRGPFPPADLRAQQLKGNPIDTSPAMRGLLVGLDRWVRMNDAPPPSRHPRLSDGTLVAQSDIKFPDIPGVQWPYTVPGGYRSDLPGPLLSHPLPFLVPQVDSDGSETGGLRLPDVSVPLATYSGWAFRSEHVGAPSEILAMVGSYIPFARTRAEREQRGDPRPSIEERYRSRAEYLRRVEQAAQQLVSERYVLPEDVARIVDRAGAHWDWLMGSSQSSQNRN